MRDILEKNFPMGSTETTPGDLEHHLTVSSEGFRDVFRKMFGKKANNAAGDKTDGNTEWFGQHVVEGTPTALELKTAGHVPFGPRFAPFFFRGKMQVLDVVKEFKNDLLMYQSLFSKYESKAKDNLRKFHKIEDEAAAFLKRDTHPNGLDEFAKLMQKWDSWITPLNQQFRDPSYEFLGYGKLSFLAGGMFASGPDTWDRSKAPESTRVAVLKPEELKPLIDLIEKAMVLQFKCNELTEDGMGVDITDPPFRGYYREVVEEYGGFKMPYAHPDFEMVNTDLFANTGERVRTLTSALISYLRNSVA
jgi:hypothetical protein